MDCIQVVKVGDSYKIVGQLEDWEKVIGNCDKHEHIESVTDMAPFTECYKVIANNEEILYIVEMFKW